MGHAERLRELFDSYLRRDLPPSEVEELVSLLEQANAEDILSEPMQRLWEELKIRQTEHAVDWDRMYRQVSKADMDLSNLKVGRGGRNGWQRLAEAGQGGSVRRRDVWGWRVLALAFLGLAGLAAYWSVIYRGPEAGSGAPGARPAFAAAGGQRDSGTAPAVAKFKTLSWQTKENKKVIHLPDGSMVILNRHSELNYSATGTTGVRDVSLSGEAYFDIVHRPEQSFLVHTGKIVTRVLGTAFNIRAYSTDKSIEVTVDHGKVQVLKAGANLGLLSDREQMRFERGTDSFHELHVNLKPVMAWKPEEISFDDITMEEATRRIGLRFKTGFNFANPALKACRISATFYMEDDLDQIMTVICGVNQSSYQIRGNTVTIDGKGCN